MTEAVSLIPIRPSEVEIGKPLRRPIYDWHGKLLLASGFVVESENQLNGLIENGFFQDTGWERGSATAPTESSASSNTGSAGSTDKTPAPSKEILVDMADVRWAVGETMFLQVLDNSALRYTVKLIGFVKNKTILMTAPMSDGKFEFIREGQSYIVRAFSGKKAYAFMASAIKSVHTPHPYLHLTYPKQVRCNVVRQAARADVKIIASLSVGEHEARSGAGMLTDLSVGGASATAKEPLGAKGEVGRVKFKLQAVGQDEFLNLQAILRWVGPAENSSGFKHGFEFVDVAMHDRLILSAFVHQTLVDAS